MKDEYDDTFRNFAIKNMQRIHGKPITAVRTYKSIIEFILFLPKS